MVLKKFSAGPVASSHRIADGKIYISFDYADSGLVLHEEDEQFMICGADRIFIAAMARVEGEEVIVWHDSISFPVAVRYGWKNYFKPTLFDNKGLPASPFRTDNFPLISRIE